MYLILSVAIGIAYTKYYAVRKTINYSQTNFSGFDKHLIDTYELSIFKKNIPIENLSVKEIIIWNSGNKEITLSDLTDGAISFYFEDYHEII